MRHSWCVLRRVPRRFAGLSDRPLRFWPLACPLPRAMNRDRRHSSNTTKVHGKRFKERAADVHPRGSFARHALLLELAAVTASLFYAPCWRLLPLSPVRFDPANLNLRLAGKRRLAAVARAAPLLQRRLDEAERAISFAQLAGDVVFGLAQHKDLQEVLRAAMSDVAADALVPK